MKFSFTGAATAPSMSVTDSGSHWQSQAWHLYVSGTFGAAGALQVEYSPDPSNVADAASRWFAPAPFLFSAGGDTHFLARFRKVRAVFTGGDGTTNVIAEIV